MKIIAYLLSILAMFALVQFTYTASSGKLGVITEKITSWAERHDSDAIALPGTKLTEKQKALFESTMQNLLNADSLVFGLHDNRFDEDNTILDSVSQKMSINFSLVHLYRSWGSGKEHLFPHSEVQEIFAHRAIPVITWEPWLQGFTSADIPGIRPAEERDKGGMADIACGLYDSFINTWAESTAMYQAPIVFRFAHEMNDPYRYSWGPHNNKGEDFCAAWHRIDSIFSDKGADNCYWIWTPHLSYGLFDEFYPGDQYVDFIGLNVLNFGSSVHWSQWNSFDKLFGKNYLPLTGYKKPLLITELGSLGYGGDRPQWYKNALHDFPERFPQVSAIIFFHVVADKTVSDKTLDWRVTNDTATLNIIQTEIRSYAPLLKAKI